MTTKPIKGKKPETQTDEEFIRSHARAAIKALRKDLQRPGLNPTGKEALNTQINYWEEISK